MTRLPLVPTLVVGLAVAAMIGLGVWQLDRREWKQGLIARYHANQARPPMAFPRFASDDVLFRRASAMCLEVTGWRHEGGRSARGAVGWRQIAQCRTGVEGPALLVDIGMTGDPKFQPQWQGGQVTGTITRAPDSRPLIASLAGAAPPPELLLVADRPAPGLEPSARPDPAGVPNNHLAYAVQWFVFATIAAVIYLLALRRRRKRAGEPG